MNSAKNLKITTIKYRYYQIKIKHLKCRTLQKYNKKQQKIYK